MRALEEKGSYDRIDTQKPHVTAKKVHETSKKDHKGAGGNHTPILRDSENINDGVAVSNPTMSSIRGNHTPILRDSETARYTSLRMKGDSGESGNHTPILRDSETSCLA